jgi:hypothetical protein
VDGRRADAAARLLGESAFNSKFYHGAPDDPELNFGPSVSSYETGPFVFDVAARGGKTIRNARGNPAVT